MCLFIALILLVGSLYCQDEESEIKTLILSNYSKSDREITLLRKINMGILGGDNWLAEWTYERTIETFICIYVINDGSVIKEMTLGANYDVSLDTDFDIMRHIPGMRVGESSCVVYDYNEDGFDEIFRYAFGGSGNIVWIAGYDPEKKKFVDYARVPFKIIDRVRGPAPVEFVTYKGMKGFKVYFFVGELVGGPSFVPSPNPKNNRWFFYTWDEEQRKFVEIEEFEENWEESYKESSQPVLAEHNTDETPVFTESDSGKSSLSV